MPHEGADVLNLPAPGAMAPYFTCEFDGRQKLIRQPHGLKLAERQDDQLFAQALQGLVFIFPPAARSRSSHRRTDFPTIQLILRLNSCNIYPGAATAGFIQARNS
jgi:hypothetical protein